MRLPPDEVDRILAALYSDAYRHLLQPWESQFVGSIALQWESKRHLTPGAFGQERKLAEVWEAVRHRAGRG